MLTDEQWTELENIRVHAANRMAHYQHWAKELPMDANDWRLWTAIAALTAAVLALAGDGRDHD